MAKTRTIEVEGIANWCKVFEQNRDMEGFNGSYEACEGAYTVDLIVEPDQYQIIKDSGSMKTGTVTDDGLKVKFIRKHIGPFAQAGGEPSVTDDTGKPWDLDSMGTIGNGSRVRIKATVYDIKKFGTTGTRLESMKVIDHVVYESPEDAPEAPSGATVTV